MLKAEEFRERYQVKSDYTHRDGTLEQLLIAEAYYTSLGISATEDIPKLLDEIERLRKMVAWQPIETAPKDGARIIVHSDFRCFRDVFWQAEPYLDDWRKLKKGGNWRLVPPLDCYRCSFYDSTTGLEPTHWKSIPPVSESDLSEEIDDALDFIIPPSKTGSEFKVDVTFKKESEPYKMAFPPLPESDPKRKAE